MEKAVMVEIEGLRERHGKLEGEIAALERRRALTPAEQIQRARLKKEKLRIKDRLLTLGGKDSRPPGDPL